MIYSPYRWTARDEIASLRSMALSRPAACREYCRLILADRRDWDASVDVDAVKAEAARLVAMLAGLKGRAAHA